MLTPYLKLFANDILLDEKVRTLSDKDLGSLIRCMAHASNNGGSIPVDPVALGKLLSIRPTSAAKLLPMLRMFFTDFKEISPNFLEDFEQFLESLFKDFGKSEGRIYSALVLNSLGPYSKVVNNNREIAAHSNSREQSKLREKFETGRSTGRAATCTSTNNAVSGLLVIEEVEVVPTVSEAQTELMNDASAKAVERPLESGGGTTASGISEKHSPPARIAKAWNAMVKAVGRADLKATKNKWAEICPLIEESLMRSSEQEHLDGIAYIGNWGSTWWQAAQKMNFQAFLRKVPEYAKKFRASQFSAKTKPTGEQRPRTVVPKITPDDLATSLARHPRGTEIWEKVQGLFPRIQVADAVAMTGVLLEGKVTPDEFIHSAEHKSGSVSAPEFMPSFGKWLSEGGYMLHGKSLTVPTKAQSKLRQNIAGGVDIVGSAKKAAEEKRQKREASKEITND